MEIRKIAVIHNDYTDKFGIPRQSGIAGGVESRIVFEKPYGTADALRGIEVFSHLWLIWEFSETPKGEGFQATVRPPRLGGNTRVGVWATRSPFRPNALGLTVVKLLRVEETEEGHGVRSPGHAAQQGAAPGEEIIVTAEVHYLTDEMPFPRTVLNAAEQRTVYLDIVRHIVEQIRDI